MCIYAVLYIIFKWVWVTSFAQFQPLFCLVYESQQHVFKSIHCILPEVHNGRPFRASISPVCGPRCLLSTLPRGRGAANNSESANSLFGLLTYYQYHHMSRLQLPALVEHRQTESKVLLWPRSHGNTSHRLWALFQFNIWLHYIRIHEWVVFTLCSKPFIISH